MTDLLHRVGEALLMAFGMFWQVGWSLVLGFRHLRRASGGRLQGDDEPRARPRGHPRDRAGDRSGSGEFELLLRVGLRQPAPCSKRARR